MARVAARRRTRARGYPQLCEPQRRSLHVGALPCAGRAAPGQREAGGSPRVCRIGAPEDRHVFDPRVCVRAGRGAECRAQRVRGQQRGGHRREVRLCADADASRAGEYGNGRRRRCGSDGGAARVCSGARPADGAGGAAGEVVGHAWGKGGGGCFLLCSIWAQPRAAGHGYRRRCAPRRGAFAELTRSLVLVHDAACLLHGVVRVPGVDVLPECAALAAVDVEEEPPRRDEHRDRDDCGDDLLQDGEHEQHAASDDSNAGGATGHGLRHEVHDAVHHAIGPLHDAL
mmetsp:Transcript_33839/g.87788  ORF Transcript_33839/g.87788 Transcript_33839/m.87788 type:complete len:286 (+) Transcript_33839:414-1271(+)